MDVLEDIMPAVGDVLDGRYRIESVLGQGGFGIVYAAWQENLGRRVAIKMLLPVALADREAVERFRREVDLVRRLEHPNTVRLFDRGETAKGLQFYVMEFVEGRTLAQVMAAEAPFAPGRVARIAAQILKSLGEAHDKGIVHRDLKPGNVVLIDVFGERDFVKVLDFGIGKLVAGAEGEESLTRGGLIGTPHYMSPEQAKEVRDLDGRSDLYALGLIMHEMCTGRRAIDAPSPLEVVMAHVAPEPVRLDPSLANTPLGLVIARASAKDRADRYPNAGSMLEALQAADLGPSAKPPSLTGPTLRADGPMPTPLASAPLTPLGPPTERARASSRLVWAVAAVVLVCGAVVAAVLLLGHGRGTVPTAAETARAGRPAIPGAGQEAGAPTAEPTPTAESPPGSEPAAASEAVAAAETAAVAEPAPHHHRRAPASAWAAAAARQLEAGVIRYCWRNNPVPGVTSAHARVTLTFAGGATVDTIRVDGVDDPQFRRCVVTRAESFHFEGTPDVPVLVVNAALRRD